MLLDLTSVLKNHRMWLDNPETGKCANLSDADLSRANLSRANLAGADLSGTDLSRADLRSANLSRADLSGTDLRSVDLSYPIYQFFLGDYHAVATPHELRIGCEAHDWVTWLSNYKDIGAKSGLSEKNILAYEEMIHLIHKLLVTNKTK